MDTKFILAAAGAATLGLAVTNGARADFVIPDDLIVQMSTCTGFDCVDGESFGFDTLRLKENNLRIHFMDTSTSVGYPNHSWQLTANDSASGGLNKFSIEDLTSATVPFTVLGSAPTNAMYVTAAGDVGLGTSAPGLDLTITRTDTPAVRLEQTSGGGFTAQTWDMGGNEANFFVRDLTSGSRLPFRIRPGAPTSSIDISATGLVGLGTASPQAPLHVLNPTTAVGGPTATFAAKTTVSILQLITNSDTNTNFWALAGDLTEFRINASAAGAVEFRLNQNGNLAISGTLTTAGPTCGGGCDKVFDADYALPTIGEHSREMWQKRHLPTVGPTPEGQPIDVSDKLGRMLNELEKAHIYIDQLHRRLEALERDASNRKG
jgi:hypothetical protein